MFLTEVAWCGGCQCGRMWLPQFLNSHFSSHSHSSLNLIDAIISVYPTDDVNQAENTYLTMLRHLLDLKERSVATTADKESRDDYWNTSTALTVSSFNAPTPTIANPKQEIATTTLYVRLNSTINKRHIHYLMDPFAPVVSVEQPEDKHGNLQSYAFVTLLSKHADIAIKCLDGKWVNQWTRLQVKRSNEQRKVETAVVKRGRHVCRAYRNGQCLDACPFGWEHRW